MSTDPWNLLKLYRSEIESGAAKVDASPEETAHLWALTMTEHMHISERTALRDSIVALLKARDAARTP